MDVCHVTGDWKDVELVVNGNTVFAGCKRQNKPEETEKKMTPLIRVIPSVRQSCDFYNLLKRANLSLKRPTTSWWASVLYREWTSWGKQATAILSSLSGKESLTCVEGKHDGDSPSSWCRAASESSWSAAVWPRSRLLLPSLQFSLRGLVWELQNPVWQKIKFTKQPDDLNASYSYWSTAEATDVT